MKILFLKGLPASGKSAFCKEFMEKNPNWKRVNKDELRTMIDYGKWSRENEELILKIRNNNIRTFLSAGFNVIVDDTNYAPKHYAQIKSIADDYLAILEVKEFDTPPAECVRRDALRENPVGKKVIWKIYNQYRAKADKESYQKSLGSGKQLAIVCDIDGALARMNRRSPYDPNGVVEDFIDPSILHILNAYNNIGVEIIILSGRKESTKELTSHWLRCNKVPYNKLITRTGEDVRKDYIVKEEIYKTIIEPLYEVIFCINDRDQVADMWRRIGGDTSK